MPSSYVMPDVISVEVQFGVDIPPKLIQVPIVRAMPDKKPFLGGYRSRKNGLEYHHATAQTDPAPRNLAADAENQKFHRETQTAVLQTRSQQSVREAGTQMPRGHLLQEEGDVVRSTHFPAARPALLPFPPPGVRGNHSSASSHPP